MLVDHRGAEWVLQSPPAEEIFTPEDLDAFQRQVAKTVRDFVEREVYPALPAMERQELDHNVRLLRELGKLELAGPDIPEAFGGQGLDKVTATVVVEAIGSASSFSVTYCAHTGIGTWPIVYFGTPAQKEQYLPALAKAEKIGAYCLTEAHSGSDALAARTTARLSADGRQWILNGTKQWISNAGFADVFVVYAKVDGDKFSAFIVDRDAPGLSTGKEERKMGIHGSSTRSVFLEDCRIPVENLLHEVGNGHHVAFNVLNLGRFMLGAGVLGGAKRVAQTAIRYAQQREQFGKAIAEFPLIQQKLAEMAERIYAAESACYRTAALLEQALGGIDYGAEAASRQSAAAIHQYSVECSIIKVLSSEMLDYVTDEAVQIHGGYGFMEEFEVCRAYRDSRINRIFEGTNEINRMLITGDLIKRAVAGSLPLTTAFAGLQDELLSLTPPSFDGGEQFEQERWLVEAARKITLMVAGLGVEQYQATVEFEQEFLAGVADMLIDIYAMESAVLRAAKHSSAGRYDLAVAFCQDAFDRVEMAARRLLAALTTGDVLRAQLAIVRKLARREPADTIHLKRRIAQRLLQAGGYAA